MLLPAPRSRRKGDKAFTLRFHLGRNISASLTADKLGALLRIAGGPLWQFRTSEGQLAIEAVSYTHLDVYKRQLVMSVNPGFGGQSFISSQLRKIEAVRKMIDKSGRDIRLEVDGGIDAATAPLAIAAGADVLVAGTATFKGGPAAYADNIKRLRG